MTACGDAVHNLRAALDHAYADIVSPYAVNDRNRKEIQFPFSETAGRLKEAVHNRLAHKVSPEFLDAIMALRPHGDVGGNKVLYLLHYLDLPDKHAHLIPTAYYMQTTAEELRKRIPDFPRVFSGEFAMGANRRDFAWGGRPLTMNEWIVNGVPENGKLKRYVDIPLEVAFEIRGNYGLSVAAPTLYSFLFETNRVLSILEPFD